ncbi:MAG: DNA polymerase III subunit gamma/tau [Pirellulales bacterium]
MTADSDPIEPTPESPDHKAEYVVVARRYRPQSFEELVGQEHVAKALSSAIVTNRVGHAYLFTGARGVGKTSAARILAKALDCETGPTPTPCNRCDICEAASVGDDVDVIEIDGASNRGIDEIRQLRSNVNVRPSRARFKIYIIDEVHMLTRDAFNALLKTLEEPPEHVKFIFCTTEPNKIPSTVLSRCQRYDFAGIQSDAIVARLAQIVAAEGMMADADALQLIARRAAGSMRDSQSLLEQLLAFAAEHITVGDVHEMLGTADSTRLLEIAQQLAAGDAASVLALLDETLGQGVDVGQLLEQLVGVFRDGMVALAGCRDDAFLQAIGTDEQAKVREVANSLGLETTLAVLEILEQALSGLRYTTHGRILTEVALVRCCKLDDLESLANLVSQLGVAAGPTTPAKPVPPAKKKSEVSLSESVRSAVDLGGLTAAKPPPPDQSDLSGADTESPVTESPVTEVVDQQFALSAANAKEIWEQTLEKLSGMVEARAKNYSQLAIPAPNRLVVSFSETYNLCKSFCERPEQIERIQRALEEVTGARVRVVFSLSDDPAREAPKKSAPSRQQKLAAIADNPMVRRARDLFGARPVDFD